MSLSIRASWGLQSDVLNYEVKVKVQFLNWDLVWLFVIMVKVICERKIFGSFGLRGQKWWVLFKKSSWPWNNLKGHGQGQIQGHYRMPPLYPTTFFYWTCCFLDFSLRWFKWQTRYSMNSITRKRVKLELWPKALD